MVKALVRRAALTVLVPLVCVGLAAGPALADGSRYYFNYRVDATATLKKLMQSATIHNGTFKGFIDFGTGGLYGSITLPPATIQLQFGVPLVTADVKIVPTKPVTGSVDFNTFTVTATATFNIFITKAWLATAQSINLVGSTCGTSKPVSVTMSGAASIGAPSTFSGLFTIPPLKTCGHLTTVLNQLIPGPGNTFSALATPR